MATGLTRAILFEAPGKPLVLREFRTPSPRGSEILVRVIACTLCGSDLHSVEGRRTVPVPTILGHEILGRIEAFGPAASRLDAAGRDLGLGDRVTWSIVASCGACFYCRRGISQKCEKQTKYGHEAIRPGYELTGGLAEHCLLANGSAIFRVPDSLCDALACPANCATATVAAAIEASGALSGQVVLIMGAGMLGVTATAWVSRLGATTIVCDRDSGRLRIANQFGASHVVSPGELDDVLEQAASGYGADIAIELTGAVESVERLLPLVRVGGKVILVGSVFPSRPVSIVPEQIVRRCLTVQGIHNYGPRHLQQALEFLTEIVEFPFEGLVSDWQPLASLQGLTLLPCSPDRLRTGIIP